MPNRAQNQHSEIELLSSLIQPRDGRPKYLAMIDMYLDESGIHDNAKVCVIAGYFGGSGQMKRLEKAWKKVLRKFDFPMKDFHAKDLVGKRKHQPMLESLSNAIAEQRKLYPISSGIIVDDFKALSLSERKFLTGALVSPKSGRFLTSGCPSKPYFVPFQHLVRAGTEYAPVGGKVHFSFGLDRSFAEYALALIKQIKVQTELKAKLGITMPGANWLTRDRIGEPLFPLASDTAPLQAADLLVHLTYNYFLQRLAKPATRPSELLDLCIANSRTHQDHDYQNATTMEAFLSNAQGLVPRWKRRG